MIYRLNISNKEYLKEDILKYALDNGMIDADNVLYNIELMKRSEILKQHNYKIWQASDKKWKTYVLDTTRSNNRRLITATTEKIVEDKIVSDYKMRNDKSLTFTSVYKQWLNYAHGSGDITQGTVDRYNVDYNRFFKNTKFAESNIPRFSEGDIIRFVKSIVNGRPEGDKIGNTCYSNIKSLIRGTFLYAKTEKELPCVAITHILQDIKISKKQFKKKLIRDSEQVFNEDEVDLLSDYILNNYKSTKELGVLFTLLTGLRIGELSTLKCKDREGFKLYIQRTEIREKDKGGHLVIKVRDYPKTEESMNGVELSNAAIYIFELITEFNSTNGINSEWLFHHGNKFGRIKSRTFDKTIRSLCKEVEIPVRSMHKLRKTYGSFLFSSGVEDKIIQSQLRHRNITTSHKYYDFSVRNSENKRNQLNKVKLTSIEQHRVG